MELLKPYHGGNKQYKIIALEGLNHLFPKTKTGRMTEFAQISETVTNWMNTLPF